MGVLPYAFLPNLPFPAQLLQAQDVPVSKFVPAEPIHNPLT